MGTRMMHYCVARNVIERCRLERGRFILGSLAPDAHTGIHCCRHGKISSHFQVPDHRNNAAFFDVDAFAERYMAGRAEIDPFVLGYCCHLATDDEWFGVVYTRYLHCGFRARYADLVQCDAEEAAHREALCYEDYARLNPLLVDHFALSKEDVPIPEDLPVDEFSRERLPDVVSGLYQDFKAERGELALFSLEVVLDHIDLATARCVTLLQPYLGV